MNAQFRTHAYSTTLELHTDQRKQKEHRIKRELGDIKSVSGAD